MCRNGLAPRVGLDALFARWHAAVQARRNPTIMCPHRMGERQRS
ncbi:hypothetical protein [Azospirillum melinis]